MAVFRRFCRMIKTALFALVVVFVSANAFACNDNQIEYQGECIDSEFEMETTDMPAGFTVQIGFGAYGTFYVDWGDGSEPCVKTFVRNVSYSVGENSSCIHKYTTSGSRLIKMSGQANDYMIGNDADHLPAIYFYSYNDYDAYLHNSSDALRLSAQWIKKIYGSLGHIFRTVNINGQLKQPLFKGLFENAVITEIPAELFDGVYGSGRKSMFKNAFAITKITRIPSGLFKDITSGAEEMFYQTFMFNNGTGNIYIPIDLFSNLTGPVYEGMFFETFSSDMAVNTIAHFVYENNDDYTPNYVPYNFLGALYSETDQEEQHMFGYQVVFDGPRMQIYNCGANLYEYDTGLSFVYSPVLSCAQGVQIYLNYDYNNYSNVDVTGTTILYTSYNTGNTTGVYFDKERRNKILPTTNGITKPIAKATADRKIFAGYYGTNGVQYIDANGKITQAGIDAASTYTNNTSWNAKWLQESYNIQYNLNGGEYGQRHPDIVELDELFTVDDPTREGWDFNGWTISGMDSGQHTCGGYHFYGTSYSDRRLIDCTRLRSSSGSVLLTANWRKTCSDGTYFRASDQSCQKCPSGYYCYGPVVNNDVTEDVGKEKCPTNYPESEEGSYYKTQCYKSGTTTCAVANPASVINGTVQYAHSGSVACKKYNLSAEEDYSISEYCLPDIGVCDIIGVSCNNQNDGLIRISSPLASLSINETVVSHWSISDKTRFSNTNDLVPDNTRPYSKGYWYDKFNNYSISGYSLCSDTEGTEYEPGNPSLTNKGNNCWCKAAYYYDNSNNYQLLISDWVKSDETFGSVNSCEEDCTSSCSSLIGWDSDMKTPIYNQSTTYMCQPSCSSNQMHYNGGCADPDFTLTTTSDTSEFAFDITASGTWYVDWGDGTVEQIHRENIADSFTNGGVDNTRYYHEYDTDDTYVIKMKGLATDYSGDDEIAAINFSSAGYEDYIASISGSLGKMFPTIDGNNSPSFKEVFNDAENLVGELPSDLFSEVTTCRDYMFQGAFTNSEITKIPSGLFSSITGGCQSMFEETFENCDELTTVEQNAFPKTQYCGDRMYAYTFDSCPKLTSIPSDLFENQQGGCMEMFENTFSSSGLTSIPEELFASINYTGEAMFDSTFAHTKITEVPSNLFPNIERTDMDLFGSMFAYCENLTTIPADLFSHFDGSMPSENAFNNMFIADTNMEFFKYSDGTKVSYIPSTFFGGLEDSGYTGGDNVAKNMFGNASTYSSYSDGVYVTKSNNTKILETCPAGTTVFNSVFKNEYAPKVSCVPISSYTVQYNINYTGGTNPSSATYTVGGNPITLPTPTRTNYYFNGWYTAATGGTEIFGTYTPTGDITLYAQWSPIYTITLNNDSGTGGINVLYTTIGVPCYESDCSDYMDLQDVYTGRESIPTPTKTGYTFGGYNNGNSVELIDNDGYFIESVTTNYLDAITGNETWTAQWTPITYTITYNLNDGTNYENAPTNYTYGVGATINGTPTKDGHEFAGWCTDSALTQCSNSQTISATTTGRKTFYAKWTPCGEFETVENNTCVCDESRYYYGTAGACQYCDSTTGQTWNGSECVCDESRYYYGEAGACQYCDPTTGQTWNGSECVSICGDGEEWNGSACITPQTQCESQGEDYHWNDEIGVCEYCDSTTGQTWNGSECVCDESRYYYGEAGACQYCDSTTQTWDGSECVCDEASNYYGTAGACQYCDPSMGQTWNEELGKCEYGDVECPTHSLVYPYGPALETAGQGFDFNDDGEITLDECFVARTYTNGMFGVYEQEFRETPTGEELWNLYNEQNTWDGGNDLNNNIAAMTFCRYNENTGNYDGNCTPAVNLCNENEIRDYLDNTDATTLSNFDYVIDLVEEQLGMSLPTSYYDQLFTESSDDITLQDRCGFNTGDDDVCPQYSSKFTAMPNGPAWEQQLFGTWYDFNGDGIKTIDECITTKVYGSAWWDFMIAEFLKQQANQNVPYSQFIPAQYKDPEKISFFTGLLTKYNSGISSMFTQQSYSLVYYLSNYMKQNNISKDQLGGVFLGSIQGFPMDSEQAQVIEDVNGQHVAGFSICRYNTDTGNYDTDCTPIIQACNISDLQQLDAIAGTTRVVDMILNEDKNAFSLGLDDVFVLNKCSCDASNDVAPDDFCESYMCPEGWTKAPESNFNARRQENTISAIWGCAPIKYKVSLNGNGADNGSMAYVSNNEGDDDLLYGTGYTLPTNDFTKTGYNFTGWNTEYDGSGTSYVDGATIKNMTTDDGVTVDLYAQWTPKKYIVNLNQNANSTDNTINTSIEATYNASMPNTNTSNVNLTVPTRSGYTFKGYYSQRTGGIQYYNANMNSVRSWDMDSANPVLYAQWNPITYYISYDGVDGATNNNPTTYNVGTAPITINEPVKTGYTFIGWCDETNPDCEPNTTNYTITTGSTGDKTLYAKWITNVYTVTYACGDGATGDAPADATATYSSVFTPAANTCTKLGYTFSGWAVSDTQDVKPAGTEFTWNYTESKTLTATWTEITCQSNAHVENGECVCDTGYNNGLQSEIRTSTGVSYASINNIGAFNESGASHGQSYYGINDNNTWAVDYGNNGMLIGQARCSTTAGADNTLTYTYIEIDSNFVDNLAGGDETGQTGANYCYCKATEYKPVGQGAQSVISPWGFRYNYSDESSCASGCASTCMDSMSGSNLSYNTNFRKALLKRVVNPQACVPNTYTVSYDINYEGGTNPADAIYTVGGNAITLPTVTRTGYDFYGWYTEPVAGDYIEQETYEPSSDITLYAHWELKEMDYTIYCNSDKEEMENLGGAQTNYGEDLNLDFIKDNLNKCSEYATHSVSGWMCNHRHDDNVLPVDFGNTGSVSWTYDDETEIACFPKWTPNTYTITLNDNGGNGGVGTIYEKYNDGFYSDSALTTSVTTVTVPTRSGYDFMGYYNQDASVRYVDENGNILATNTTFNDNVTLYAQWGEIITGGDDPVLPEPDTPSASFCPKYEDTPGYDPEHYKPIGAWGSYPANSYYYYYYSPAGRDNKLAGCQLFYAIDNTLVPHTKEGLSGYTHTMFRSFYNPTTGNYEAGTAIQYSGVSTNVALHCADGYSNKQAGNGMIWYSTLVEARENACTVKNSGTTMINDVEECPLTYPNADSGATSLSQCYATVSFVTNGGSSVESVNINYSSDKADGYSLSEIPVTTKDNYEFIGWYDNEDMEGEPITIETVFGNGNQVLYANWTPSTYTITYNLNGGTNYANAPESYNIETPTIILGTPTKDLNMFTGWYGGYNENSGEYEGEKIETIPLGSTGDKNLYASWTECEVCNAGTGASCELSVVNNVCTYTTDCLPGYENIVGNGTTTPSCSPKYIPITLNNQSANTESVPTTVYLKYTEGWYYKDANDQYVALQNNKITSIPQKDEYIFRGYYTATNGSGTNIADDNGMFHTTTPANILTFTTVPTTIYANWELKTYRVTYSCGVSETTPPTDNNDYAKGNSFKTAESSVCTIPNGYASFKNWVVTGNDTGTNYGTKSQNSSTSYAWSENVTLTANFQGNSIKIAYDENGGTSVSDKNCYYGDTGIVLPVDKKAGSIFAGWKTFKKDANNNAIIYSDGDTIDCTYEYLGVYTGTSTNVVAQWDICPADSYCPGDNTQNACPEGYDDNTVTGKVSISDCKIKCPCGTYLASQKATQCTACAAGKYSSESLVGYNQTSQCITASAGYYATGGCSQTPCAIGSYNSSSGKSTCQPCAKGKTTSTSGSTSCVVDCGNKNNNVYSWLTPVWNSNNTVSNVCQIDQCYAGSYYKDNACPTCADNFYSSSNGATSCIACSEGYTTKENSSVRTDHDSASDCKIKCNGGYYIANAYDEECSEVGAGYWAPESEIIQGQVGTKNKCSVSGETTAGYGAGADDVGDCGRRLHVGDAIVWLKSIKDKTPSAVIPRDGKNYYARMSRVAFPMDAGEGDFFKTRYNNKEYYIHDDLGEAKIYDVVFKLTKNVTLEANKNGFLSNDGTYKSSQATFGLTDNGTWGADYGYGRLLGESSCSAETGTNYTADSDLVTYRDSVGSNCWCRLNKVDNVRVVLSWVNLQDSGITTDLECARNCANRCSKAVANSTEFRRALFGGVVEQQEQACDSCLPGTGAYCELTDDTNCEYDTYCLSGYHGLTGDGTSTPACTPNTYTVKYNANGGSGTMSNSLYEYGEYYNLSSNGFSRSGYSFAGWGTSSSDTIVAYVNKARVVNLTSVNGGVVNLYAIWSSNSSTPVSTDYDTSISGYRQGSLGHSGASSSSGTLGLTVKGTWGVDFKYDGSGPMTRIKGEASCNTYIGIANKANSDVSASVSDTDGPNCWCRSTTASSVTGSTETNTTSAVSDWVFYGTIKNTTECTKQCAKNCATKMKGTADFRKAIYGSL